MQRSLSFIILSLCDDNNVKIHKQKSIKFSPPFISEHFFRREKKGKKARSWIVTLKIFLSHFIYLSEQVVDIELGQINARWIDLKTVLMMMINATCLLECKRSLVKNPKEKPSY